MRIDERTGPWLLGSPAMDLTTAGAGAAGRPADLHRVAARLLADDRASVYAVAGSVDTELAASVRGVGAVPVLRARRS